MPPYDTKCTNIETASKSEIHSVNESYNEDKIKSKYQCAQCTLCGAIEFIYNFSASNVQQ